jgi:hypothetical protein
MVLIVEQRLALAAMQCGDLAAEHLVANTEMGPRSTV